MQSITVVVPYCDEACDIGPLVESIPAHYPVVIVDTTLNGRAEQARALRPNLTTVLQRDCDIPLARQIGADVAETVWIVYTDAALTFAPDYFATLRSHLRFGAKYGAIYGTQRAAGRDRQGYRWLFRVQKFCDRFGVPIGSGANLVLRRDALRAIGGFDLSMGDYAEADLLFRMKRYGYPIAFEPDMAVVEAATQPQSGGARRAFVRRSLLLILLYFNLLPTAWRGSILRSPAKRPVGFGQNSG